MTPGIAVCATHTLSFITAKPGLFTGDGPDHCGSLDVAPLDLDVDALAGGPARRPGKRRPAGRPRALRRALAATSAQHPQGHFRQRRHSRRRPGDGRAALLAGRAALKLGTGRVFVGFAATPLAVDPVQPELMLRSADGCSPRRWRRWPAGRGWAPTPRPNGCSTRRWRRACRWSSTPTRST